MAEPTYKRQAWSLADLYPGFDTRELQEALDEVNAQANAFEAMRPQLSPDMNEETFVEMLAAYESLSRISRRVGYYAQLRFSEDTQN